MSEGKRILQRVVHGSKLCQEPLPFVPLVEIMGYSRVLIENHKSILSYSTEEIHVHVKYGVIAVIGKRLLLSQMSKERIIITGIIECVQLMRGYEK